MKTLYLIRHTTPDISKDVCYGQADLDVTDTFEDEVKEITTHIPKKDISHIFSSPLQRCSVLAKRLFPQHTIEYNSLLKEINFGAWELLKWTDIPKKEMEKWSADFVHLPPPKGESLAEMNNRAVKFLKACSNTLNDNETAAIVTHSGIIRCLVSNSLSIPLNKIFRLKFNYASVVKLTLYDTHEEVEILKS